jgi:AraC family transcriptional regulator, exoenzyme S synthesis regulatory protein ExsA
LILESKIIELQSRKFAEYIRVKTPYRWQTTLSDEACFIYWLNGKNRLYSANQQIITGGQDALLLRCGTYIDDVMPADANEAAAVIVHFWPQLLKTIFKNEFPSTIRNDGNIPAVHSMNLKQDEWLRKYVDSLLFYFENPELAHEELLLLKMKELILLLSKTQKRHTLSQVFHYLFTPAEFHFKQLIDANIYANLSLKELAALSRRSLSSFKRDFQKYYHTNPADYIRKRKLKKAVHLLETTNMRIKEIVIECGFNNLSHFTRLFRKEYQLPPSEFRLNQTAK